MKFQSHLLVTYLLLLFFSPRGVMVEENMVWGILAQSISLDIPDLPKGQEIDDIRWSEGQTLIGKVSSDKVTTGKNTNYEIFINGTLKIRELKAVSEQNYTVSVYNKNGKNLLKKTLTLNVMEAVSKPEMTWNCTLKSIFCVTQNGTNPEMTLYINGTHPLKKGTLTKEGLKLKYTWEDPLPREFKCVVKNKVSEEWVVGQPSCSVRVLDIYHILSICGGGVILLIFLTLLISCCLRRKRQSNQTNGSWFRLYFQDSIKSGLLLQEKTDDELQRSRKMGGGFCSPSIGRE
ncbi:T-cell surface antigen CD2 isoform X3 [Macrotis lagotis]|uniref:T-cell surface antigen CD2 isoform X3 n=1 Tax=Macrotis lagotis TaxID=92651 RepID=UPI003D6988D0